MDSNYYGVIEPSEQEKRISSLEANLDAALKQLACERDKSVELEQQLAASNQARVAEVMAASVKYDRLKAERDAEREMCLGLLFDWMDGSYIPDHIGEDTYNSTREYLIEFHPTVNEGCYPDWYNLLCTDDDDDYLDGWNAIVPVEVQSFLDDMDGILL